MNPKLKKNKKKLAKAHQRQRFTFATRQAELLELSNWWFMLQSNATIGAWSVMLSMQCYVTYKKPKGPENFGAWKNGTEQVHYVLASPPYTINVHFHTDLQEKWCASMAP